MTDGRRKGDKHEHGSNNYTYRMPDGCNTGVGIEKKSEGRQKQNETTTT